MRLVPSSLRTRMVIGALAVLATFLTAAGIGQERAFRAAALSAEHDKLRGLIFALLGVTEPSARGGLVIADFDLPDARLTQPESGLSAWLLTVDGQVVWRSPSALHAPPDTRAPEMGSFAFDESDAHFLAAYRLRWVTTDAEARPYHLVLEASKQPFREQLVAYRRQLTSWLAAAAVGLLVALAALLAWLLTPLRRMERQLRRVEAGEADELGGHYPDELRPLADALNALVRTARNRQARYRNALGDLAHSLKTPLAVIDGMLREDEVRSERLREQVDRMRRITEHQLVRAAHAGGRPLAEPLLIAPVASKLANTLGKVYRDKGATFRVSVPADLRARVDEGDLYELMGNLLDNAGKWCRQEVRLNARCVDEGLEIEVEDDGPGFPDDAENLLARGQRADEQVAGQGLGLAAVAELVTLYEGRISLGRSTALKGACVSLLLKV